MKNEAQDNRTGSGTGRDGKRGIRGKRIESNGAGTSGESRGRAGAGAEPAATTGTVGTPSIENRGQPRRYQRKSTPAEAAPKRAGAAPATAEAGTGKATTTASATAQTPDRSEPEVSGPAFEVSETRELAASTIAKKAWTNRKRAKEQAEQTAITLLTILDGAVGMTLGGACMMTPDEHKMIDEPLARILARMTPETTELIDKWTDPLLLATGLIMWGARVFLVLSREVKREAKKHKPTMTQPEPAESSTGIDLNRPIQATGIPVEVAEALG